MKSAGRVEFARMPPTVAAARKIASGRVVSSQSSTSACRRRSSSVRGTTMISHDSFTRRRTIADPTMPRCPATQTFFPSSSNAIGCEARSVMPLVPLRLERDLLDIRIHHLANQFLETDGVPPAETLLGLSRIAEQNIDFSGPEISWVDFNQQCP